MQQTSAKEMEHLSLLFWMYLINSIVSWSGNEDRDEDIEENDNKGLDMEGGWVGFNKFQKSSRCSNPWSFKREGGKNGKKTLSHSTSVRMPRNNLPKLPSDSKMSISLSLPMRSPIIPFDWLDALLLGPLQIPPRNVSLTSHSTLAVVSFSFSVTWDVPLQSIC